MLQPGLLAGVLLVTALMIAPSAQASWLRKKGHQPQVYRNSPEKSLFFSDSGHDWRSRRVERSSQLQSSCYDCVGNECSCGSDYLPQVAHVQATEGWFSPAATSLQSARHTLSSAAQETDRKVVKPLMHQAQHSAAETQRWFRGMVGRLLPTVFDLLSHQKRTPRATQSFGGWWICNWRLRDLIAHLWSINSLGPGRD